jgi:polyisoprenoid-binding protein YceI
MTARACRGLIAVAALLLVPAALARADTYTLDPEHTEVRFSWNHLGMSRQSGRILDVKGTVEFEPAEPEASSVEVVMKLASLTTSVPALDKHLLKTKDFFDLASHPTMTFRSTAVKKTGGKTALVSGDLTINGISRPVVLETTWNFSGEHPMAKINPAYSEVYASGFSARTQIFRSDFGITRTIPFVSDEIQITIETEMHRTAQSPAESAATALPAPEPYR